jgi:hypothetical protein
MPTGQYGQIYGQGVKYIKVNRFDSGGLDRSDYLGQLTNLTITYDDLGSIQYNIVTTQEQDTYFVYGIQTRFQNTSSVNYEVLDYSFDADCSAFFTISPGVTHYLTGSSFTWTVNNDSLNGFTNINGRKDYTYPITPNIPIEFYFTCSFFESSVGQISPFVYLYNKTTNNIEAGWFFGAQTDTTVTVSGSYILSGSSNPIENNQYIITIGGQGSGGTTGTWTFTSFNWNFTQSNLTNPATSSLTIFEPEFIDFEYNDYNALFGNAETPQFSFQFMDVDYTSTYDEPVNFGLIISGTADRAPVQDSNYSSNAWSDLRYNGVKSEAPDFNQLTTNGGYGFDPNVEQNKTFIAYFDNVGGTGPELISQTAYNIKYLIDTNGNVTNPEPNFPSLYNIIDSFESGKNAIVRLISNDPLETENPNDDALTGLHPITSVGRISSILVTETGSRIPDFVRTMSFTDINGNQLNPNVVNFQGSARREGEFYMNNTNWTPIPFNLNYQNPPISPIWGQAGQFNAPNGTYTFNSSSTEGNTSVFLNFSIRMRNPSPLANTIFLRVFNYTTNQEVPYPNSNGGFNTSTTIQIQGNGGEARIVPGNGSLFIFSGGSSYTQVFGGKLGPLNISDGDEIGLEYQASSGDPNRQVVFVTNSGTQILGDTSWDPFFEIGQLYPPGEFNVNGDNIATSSYWSQGSNEYVGLEAINYNLTTTITASQALTELWNKGRKQTLPTASAEIGFSPIGLPFSQELNSPAPGDWIRFEYNKDYRLFNITEVGTTTASTGSLYLKLYPAFTSGSIQLNHFVMYRILNDGTYVILDIEKPVSGSGFTGIIQPEYISQDLKDNYNNIIQDLTQRGVIS